MEENIKIYTLKQKQSLFRSSSLRLYSRSRENKNKPNARPKTKETAVTIVGILMVIVVVGPPFSAKKLLLMLPLL
tara:strand:+ start:1335 stop:1559 length:225 start_codon:yes stop_codon:yes gene_type:complete